MQTNRSWLKKFNNSYKKKKIYINIHKFADEEALIYFYQPIIREPYI